MGRWEGGLPTQGGVEPRAFSIADTPSVSHRRLGLEEVPKRGGMEGEIVQSVI